jgi:hypothetical protein
MYFRRKTSAGRAYLQIVESRRTGDQVRQQVIATLGRYEDLQASGQLDRLSTKADASHGMKFLYRTPRKIAPTRQTPQNCLRMIPLRSRSDSFTFTPGPSAIASDSNFSRCPTVLRF